MTVAVDMTSPKSINTFRALVLNADMRPLSTAPLSLISWRDAVENVCRGSMQTIENYEGIFIRSQKLEMPVPKVVAATTYIKGRVKAVPTLNRWSCALRDDFCCGYCGIKLPAQDLTFDHVIPRQAGGRSTWDNLLMACQACNSKKGHEKVNWKGTKGVVKKGNFTPLRRPYTPTYGELYKKGLRHISDENRAKYGEWLPPVGNVVPKPSTTSGDNWESDAYWTVELDP